MTPHDNGAQPDDLDSLKKQNADLRQRLAELQAERDAYVQRAVASVAKQMITEEVVQGWMTEKRAEGSMLDFINLRGGCDGSHCQQSNRWAENHGL